MARLSIRRTISRRSSLLFFSYFPDPQTPFGPTRQRFGDVRLSRPQRHGSSASARKLALKIQETDHGPDNPQLGQTLSLYTAVEHRLGKMDTASALSYRAAAIRRKSGARR